VEANPEDFRRHFELLSDAQLLATHREDLVEIAKQCFDDEVSRRGLDTAIQRTPGELNDRDRLVQVAKFHFRSEFRLAKALLQSESIPATQGSRIGRRIELQLPLMVPAAFAQEALALLQSRVSDEELAARAEETIRAGGAGEAEDTELEGECGDSEPDSELF
jgi:hypothetical protein